jgi:hypothetical protein
LPTAKAQRTSWESYVCNVYHDDADDQGDEKKEKKIFA